MDDELVEDIDSAIYEHKEEEVWLPSLKQRAIAGLILAGIYTFLALSLWEPSLGEISIVGSTLLVLTLLLGGKFVKVVLYFFLN